ncbi:MAG: MBL fold metallo-hydrolase [Candidatus Eisenbacteria bacterium]|uniref:MBL fold metallo-hydrolase n=1 Tax=Eiseniibacteriota bacterium TaxID=2212470 RepID=A0A948S420_UNCEI|nr:MBL fold metallo-hydrolase [Candidatus Eisenbacteria bacterium]MBU1949601.1 MBL fold metallo-hydrolase [Candidatus Eisenbacteria bacterium]MBU2693439.1 MBL fold metallo-hydrolase [Candidatus Eisenbacteria bacterium]
MNEEPEGSHKGQVAKKSVFHEFSCCEKCCEIIDVRRYRRVLDEMLETLEKDASGINSRIVLAGQLLKIAASLLEGTREERDLNAIVAGHLIREDAFVFARDALIASAPGDLFSFTVLLSLTMTAARGSDRGYEALDLFRQCLPNLVPLLRRNPPTISSPFPAMSHLNQKRCLTDVRRILHSIGLADYFAFFSSGWLESIRSDPATIEVANEPNQADSGDMKIGLINDSYFVREISHLKEASTTLESLTSCAAYADLSTRLQTVIENIGKLYYKNIDKLRVKGARNAIDGVRGTNEISIARDHWLKARSYLESSQNRDYRLSKLYKMVQKPLDSSMHGKFHDKRVQELLKAMSEDPIVNGNDLRTLILDRTKDPLGKRDCLCVVRRWSSAHPLVQGAKYEENLFGGGLFLSARGFGLVIDPGVDYISNLRFFTPFEFDDIDAVVVTHSHVDHNASLDQILALSHERSRNIGADGKFSDKGIDLIVCESEPDPRIHLRRQIEECNGLGQCKTVDDCMRRQICSRSYGGVNAVSYLSELGREGDLKMWERELGGAVLRVEAIRVKHRFRWDDISAGLLITLTSEDGNEVKIGYTSDTEYFSADAGSGIRRAIWESFGGCDILVANVCSVTFPDLMLEAGLSNHLGLSGVRRLLSEIEPVPSVVILNEWALQGAAMDYRLLAAQYLESMLDDNGRDTKILVGEIGLRVSWSETGAPLVVAACSHGIQMPVLPAKVFQTKADNSELKPLIQTLTQCPESHETRACSPL